MCVCVCVCVCVCECVCVCVWNYKATASMRCIKTFRSTTDRKYDCCPKRL